MSKRSTLGGSAHADRVFRVQRAFTEVEGQMHGPGELAEATGLDDSTVHRILQSGVYDGIFAREGHGLYRLGAGAARLGLKSLAHAPNARVAHAVLEDLHTATDGGLAFLFALAPFGGAGKQCLDMAVGASDLSELGVSPRALVELCRSLRTGAAGRAILAFLPKVIQDGVLAEPVPDGAGPGAFRDDARLLASLESVRKEGLALDVEEWAEGWVGCAAPVRWDGLIMGSVAVLKPGHDMSACSVSAVRAVRRAASCFTPGDDDHGPWSEEAPGSY
ncbi:MULTISPECIES: IclR family transcriptional regulator [unclassified Streptomyces]|uniref:IclR family transcriptional regulator n=1 Tax=unclassified Streptomyces TaxID=2593676 RepID=UPI003642FD78